LKKILLSLLLSSFLLSSELIIDNSHIFPSHSYETKDFETYLIKTIKSTNIRFQIVADPNIESISDYSYSLFKYGAKGIDTSVVLFVIDTRNKKIKITVSKPLKETLNKKYLKELEKELYMNFFVRSDYYNGLKKSINKIQAKLSV